MLVGGTWDIVCTSSLILLFCFNPQSLGFPHMIHCLELYFTAAMKGKKSVGCMREKGLPSSKEAVPTRWVTRFGTGQGRQCGVIILDLRLQKRPLEKKKKETPSDSISRRNWKYLMPILLWTPSIYFKAKTWLNTIEIIILDFFFHFPSFRYFFLFLIFIYCTNNIKVTKVNNKE